MVPAIVRAAQRSVAVGTSESAAPGCGESPLRWAGAFPSNYCDCLWAWLLLQERQVDGGLAKPKWTGRICSETAHRSCSLLLAARDGSTQLGSQT